MQITYKLLSKRIGMPTNWKAGMEIGVGDGKTTYSPCDSRYTEMHLPAYMVENDPLTWQKSDYAPSMDDFEELRKFFWEEYSGIPDDLRSLKVDQSIKKIAEFAADIIIENERLKGNFKI